MDRRQQGLEIIRYDRVVIRKPNDIRYFFTIKIDPMHPKTIINITLSGYAAVSAFVNLFSAKNLYLVASALHLFSKLIGICCGSGKKSRQESMEGIDDFH